MVRALATHQFGPGSIPRIGVICGLSLLSASRDFSTGTLVFPRAGEGRGGGALPINGIMGMCRWMGSHFHDWIDYNWVAFSTEFPTEFLKWGRKSSRFWG